MYPYLTTARFPHNWAIADMVKGYLAGTRKELNRQAREDGGEEISGSGARLKKTTARSSRVDEQDDSDDSDHRPQNKKKKTGSSSNSSTKVYKPTADSTPKSKKRPRSDSLGESVEGVSPFKKQHVERRSTRNVSSALAANKPSDVDNENDLNQNDPIEGDPTESDANESEKDSQDSDGDDDEDDDDDHDESV
jgi:hypothetical protein